MSPGFVVSALATLTTGLITLWLLYEDWAVWHSDKSGAPRKVMLGDRHTSLEDRKADHAYVMAHIRNLARGDNTITAWTRYYERLLDSHHQSHWLLVFVLILGLCLGHLLWH